MTNYQDVWMFEEQAASSMKVDGHFRSGVLSYCLGTLPLKSGPTRSPLILMSDEAGHSHGRGIISDNSGGFDLLSTVMSQVLLV